MRTDKEFGSLDQAGRTGPRVQRGDRACPIYMMPNGEIASGGIQFVLGIRGRPTPSAKCIVK